MATDAEILRTIADHSYMGATASGDAALVVLATDLPKGDIDEAIQRAATALDENARLRAALETVRTITTPSNPDDPIDPDAINHIIDIHEIVRAAIRTPDAGGTHGD